MDLHTHTHASDGTCTPFENVRLAKEAHLAAVAITDHDTTAGIDEALKAGKELGIEVVPGIEISSAAKGQDIHVLGYFIPHEDEVFLQELEKLRNVRRKRNEKIIARLQEIGVDITWEDVYNQQVNSTTNIGRPHIAQVLMNKGYVSSVNEAFEKYLGKEGRAYTQVERITPQEAIGLIKSHGGAAVLAHSGLYADDELVEELIVYGLDGIEIWHPDHDGPAIQRYLQLAEQYGLIKTGGSDFHGWRGEDPYHAMLGSHTAPSDSLERLRKTAQMRRK